MAVSLKLKNDAVSGIAIPAPSKIVRQIAIERHAAKRRPKIGRNRTNPIDAICVCNK